MTATAWDGITDSFDALPFSEGFTGFATAIADRVVEFFREFGFMGFIFLILMGVGCIIVFTLAAKSLIDVMDWRIFAQFGRFVTDRPMSHSRAVRFQVFEGLAYRDVDHSGRDRGPLRDRNGL